LTTLQGSSGLKIALQGTVEYGGPVVLRLLTGSFVIVWRFSPIIRLTQIIGEGEQYEKISNTKI
jgi:hypothetical protein